MVRSTVGMGRTWEVEAVVVRRCHIHYYSHRRAPEEIGTHRMAPGEVGTHHSPRVASN